MPTFRDLWIWKESHQLMLEIHQTAKVMPREERFRLRDQIERSSSSVSDNISEGYTAYYFNDKIKGMLTARKEAGETQNHIETMTGKGYLLKSKADKWVNAYERVIAGINSYVNYIREKREGFGRKGAGKNSLPSRISRSPDFQVPDPRISGLPKTNGNLR